MPKFSKASMDRLKTCDIKLQVIALEAIKEFDFTVVCGYRGEKDQNEAFARGASKLKWPDSKY